MKTELKNSILCSPLRVIKYKDGWLAVDEINPPKENTNTFKQGFNGDWYYNATYKTIAQIGDITLADYKILAAPKRFKLPVWELPERDDVDEIAHETAISMWKDHSGITKDQIPLMKFVYSQGYKEGYRAAGKYSEEDMAGIWLQGGQAAIAILEGRTDYVTFKQYLSSLEPKYAWCEVEEIFVPFNEQRYGTPKGEEEGELEEQFVITNNKLTVIEWE